MAFNYQSNTEEDLYQDLFYPMYFNLNERKVVVLGGGKVAERKVLTLLEYRAQVTLISPELTDALDVMADAGIIEYIDRRYEYGDLKDAVLVISAVGDVEVDKDIYNEAQEHHIPINVVDYPELCTFTVPSVVRRDPVQIAISTGGNSPAYAQRIRRELEEEFPMLVGPYVTMLGNVRDLIKARIADDGKTRARLLHTIVDSDLFERFKANPEISAQEVYQEFVQPELDSLKD
ncbi:MAG: bifunctional precorrin-2 dehydrogenase/sirohydrochlorin ferrochelatase [Coriobacteriia bacterium]|nr:bifunctional precorrin-2 dehydrogenase/sirohydrochlorin ferrochelatase [Coriobacteriia bacterium]